MGNEVFAHVWLGDVPVTARVPAEDLTGRTFGRWTVVRRVAPPGPMLQRISLCLAACLAVIAGAMDPAFAARPFVTAAHVQAIAKVADGVVVGSALVNVVAAHKDNKSQAAAAIGAKVRELLAK